MPRPDPATSDAPFRYRVAMPEPQSHELHVTMDLPPLPGRDRLVFALPAWAPGSYMIRDFARNVYDLEVTDARGRPLPVTRLDKQRWEVTTGGGATRLRYRVFAFEETVRTSLFDDRHAYWNGSSLFFYVEEELARPCLVVVEPRRGWRVSTALPEEPGALPTFRARGYDELADSPFEVGNHDVHAFRVGGTRFEVALFGPTNAQLPRLLSALRKIVEATGQLMGGFPFSRYLFIIHCLGARGGGLEHAASCTLDIAGLGFEDDKAYQRFAELAAHEFFHAWNVKRIRDRLLGPFDYGRETHTRLLWLHEGFTEFMEAPILLKAGLLDVDVHLKDLAEEWQRYSSRPGRSVTPLSELSFEAWIKLYKPADNHTNRTVSYYEKGKWAALVLELMLREATGGRRGVVDLFRRLWRDFGRKDRGLTEVDVEEAVAAVAGRPMPAYFRRFIHGTDELPVLALLRRTGIRVEQRPAYEEDEDATRSRRGRSWSGLVLTSTTNAERAIVRTVVPGSPAWNAGLTYQDELVAVNGQRVNAASALRRFADHAPGDSVEVSFFRRDQLRTTQVTLAVTPERKLTLSLEPRPSRTARSMRRGWLGR